MAKSKAKNPSNRRRRTYRAREIKFFLFFCGGTEKAENPLFSCALLTLHTVFTFLLLTAGFVLYFLVARITKTINAGQRRVTTTLPCGEAVETELLWFLPALKEPAPY